MLIAFLALQFGGLRIYSKCQTPNRIPSRRPLFQPPIWHSLRSRCRHHSHGTEWGSSKNPALWKRYLTQRTRTSQSAKRLSEIAIPCLHSHNVSGAPAVAVNNSEFLKVPAHFRATSRGKRNRNCGRKARRAMIDLQWSQE